MIRTRHARVPHARRLITIAFISLSASASHAALVTSTDQMPSASRVVDFSEFAALPGTWIQTSGPVQIGSSAGEDIQWSTTSPYSVIGNGGYGLGSNGGWDPGRQGYTGLGSSGGSMTFRFHSEPVSAVGGFVNYAPGFGGNTRIEALDATGNVLESHHLDVDAPIHTPRGHNEGAFRGIVRLSPDIAALRVSNQYVVLDDLTFDRSCGNATVDPGEDCDEGAANGTTASCCSTTCAFVPSGETCDDGDACTRTDECDGAGACAGGNPVLCTALDQCHEPGTCNPADGECDDPVRQDGSACSDDDACTLADRCQAGACEPGPSTMLDPLADPRQTLQCVEQTLGSLP